MALRIVILAVSFGVLTLVSFAVQAAQTSGPSDSQVSVLIADSERTVDLWKTFQRKAFPETFALAKPLADEGSPHAQYLLGELYFGGLGVERDFEVANNWLNLAASQEHPLALNRLSRIYADGIDAPVDLLRAREFSARGAASFAASARYYAAKTAPVLLWHRAGEGPIHRYWLERARFFSAFENRFRRWATQPQPDKDANVSLRSLPASCRPSAPPSSAMTAAKLDRLEGELWILVDQSGRVEGIAMGQISDERLRFAAFDTFRTAFRSDGCVISLVDSEPRIVIPFLFRLE